MESTVLFLLFCKNTQQGGDFFFCCLFFCPAASNFNAGWRLGSHNTVIFPIFHLSPLVPCWQLDLRAHSLDWNYSRGTAALVSLQCLAESEQQPAGNRTKALCWWFMLFRLRDSATENIFRKDFSSLICWSSLVLVNCFLLMWFAVEGFGFRWTFALVEKLQNPWGFNFSAKDSVVRYLVGAPSALITGNIH